jgi:hypothetical protein
MFGMYSRGGNNVVQRMVEVITETWTPAVSQERVLTTLRNRMALVAQKFPEVYDTVVREQIALVITGSTYLEIDAADLRRSA